MKQAGEVFSVLNSAQGLALARQTQQIRDTDMRQKQADELRTIAGSMYNTKATPQQVWGAVALRARQGGFNPDVAYNFILEMQKPENEADFEGFLKNQRTQAAGREGLFQTQTVYPPVGGQPYAVPAANVPAAGVGAGQSPGYESVATGPGGAGGINNMVSMANDAPNQQALLSNLNDLSNEAVSGPTSDFEKRANALALRLFGKTVTLTPQQLASSEEYGKISEQLAGQQAAAAHATDAYLRNAYSTNPGLYLSKIGRQGITHMLQGNVDSIVAKNNAWTSYANGEVDGRMHSPAEFANWNKNFNRDFNPRVFQYARMTGDERAKFRSNMSIGDQKKLAKQIQQYQAAGWVDLGQ
jgi:hypothetical protein